MTRHVQRLFVQFLAGVGYFVTLLGWFFVFTIYFSVASHQEWFTALFETHPEVVAPVEGPVVQNFSGGLLQGIIVIVVVGALLAAIVYTLRHLPGTIVRSGEAVTHVPAEVLVPLVAHHKKLTKKRRLQLTARLVVVMKVVIILLPLGLLLPTLWLDAVPLEQSALWAIAFFLAGAAAGCFGLERLFGLVLRLDAHKTD